MAPSLATIAVSQWTFPSLLALRSRLSALRSFPLALSPMLLVLTSSLLASDWPQWHGPNRDRHSSDPAALTLKTFPDDWTPLWRQRTGPGHASPIVLQDTLIYLDQLDGQTVAHALDATTGRERWQTPFAGEFGDEWGDGPRCTPFAEGDRVYVQSSTGEFRCLDLPTGRVIWGLSFTKDLGSKFIGSRPGPGAAARRGYNGSGLIDGNNVILPVGSSEATLLCCDKLTGKEQWRAGTDVLAYSSLMLADLAGIRQVLTLTASALMGVRATDGALLWRIPLKTAAQRHVATPLIAGNLVIVNSHTFGTIAIRVVQTDSGCNAEIAWRNPDLKTNLSTAVLVNDHLYNLGANKDFVCLQAVTGKLAWSQPDLLGAGRRDYAATLNLGDRLLVLTDDGILRLLEANPTRYVELAQTQACGITWTVPAIAQGRLYIRDGRQLVCLPLNHD